ncbi:prepilin-type N-terminal cleavage/methylation domain-containing protein [Parelusimicrobium proximum]|uniref:type IV pilin protein n=1 Tax=Parelusimicrobium proximum TaxID=3228953 RepID=UPI003D178244
MKKGMRSPRTFAKANILRTPQHLGGGFTLIELLVVVLIIAILAAVALPQYTKAVEKSRAAEMYQMMSAIRRAVQFALLVNPDEPPKFDKLVIDIPGAVVSNEATYSTISTGNFRYRSGYGEGSAAGSPVISASRIKGGVTMYIVIETPANQGSSCDHTCCWYKADQEAMCKTLGYTETASAGCSSGSLGCSKAK